MILYIAPAMSKHVHSLTTRPLRLGRTKHTMKPSHFKSESIPLNPSATFWKTHCNLEMFISGQKSINTRRFQAAYISSCDLFIAAKNMIIHCILTHLLRKKLTLPFPSVVADQLKVKPGEDLKS